MIDDKYFEELLNEEKEPFSGFINRVSLSMFSPLHRLETLPESSNSVDFESPKVRSLSFSLESEQSNFEKLKEYSPAEEVNDMAISQNKCVAKAEQKVKVYSEAILLKSYEMIEKFKNTMGYEFYEILNETYISMREAN
eukprot:TRINITY_DN8016_c0_g3_i1.p1 TRINITY_DN8016_c0_g3~~TRINITY_DN8016_c0_g3_i1.p1  ORF type:complete len:139 (-),score=38.32 TRINITY_DN8016_c0_g3_i1:389-805(-)